MPPWIALMTDFGMQDAYVGVMKGVIASIAPRAQVVDITHGIPPGDIRQAAFRLWQSSRYFPGNTIFVVVVDPGVGTGRRPVGVRVQNQTFVLPDNGLLTFLLAQSKAVKAVEVRAQAYRLMRVSSTFHGRDVFAPAAAHLATGVPLRELGPPIEKLENFPLPWLTQKDPRRLEGEILHGDRFGNLITSLGVLRSEGNELQLEPWLPGVEPIRMTSEGLGLRLPKNRRLGLYRTFGEVSAGEPLCYIGSDGLVEIAVNRGSAADALSLEAGDRVMLEYEG